MRYRRLTSNAHSSSLVVYVSWYTVTAASLLLYYIFLFYQSMTAFVEFNKARKAYREKKTEVKPALAGIKYGSDNLNMLAANRK